MTPISHPLLVIGLALLFVSTETLGSASLALIPGVAGVLTEQRQQLGRTLDFILVGNPNPPPFPLTLDLIFNSFNQQIIAKGARRRFIWQITNQPHELQASPQHLRGKSPNKRKTPCPANSAIPHIPHLPACRFCNNLLHCTLRMKFACSIKYALVLLLLMLQAVVGLAGEKQLSADEIIQRALARTRQVQTS